MASPSLHRLFGAIWGCGICLSPPLRDVPLSQSPLGGGGVGVAGVEASQESPISKCLSPASALPSPSLSPGSPQLPRVQGMLSSTSHAPAPAGPWLPDAPCTSRQGFKIPPVWSGPPCVFVPIPASPPPPPPNLHHGLPATLDQPPGHPCLSLVLGAALLCPPVDTGQGACECAESYCSTPEAPLRAGPVEGHEGRQQQITSLW